MPQLLRPATLLSGFAPAIVRVGSGYSPSLDALLTEAALNGLMLDFAQGQYWRAGVQSATASGVSGWSYTRSGTRFAGDSALTSFGANTPRIVAGSGIRVTAGATNLLLQSQTFNTTWAADAVAVTADNHAAPDGTLTADRVLEDSTTALHRIRQDTLTISAGAQVTASVFVKNASGSRWLAIQINGATGSAVVHFNPVTGAFGVAGVTAYTGTVASAVSLANGWWRFILTTTTVTDTAINVRLQFKEGDGTAGSYAGDGASGFFLWGAQLETGSVATDYIPTTSASATAGADAASVTFTTALPYSVIGEVAPFSTAEGSQRIIGYASAQTPLYFGGTSVSTFNGTTVVSKTGLTALAGRTIRAAAAHATGDVAVTADGAAVQTGTAAVAGSATQQLGSDAGSSQYVSGWLRLVAILPRRISNAELQAATL